MRSRKLQMILGYLVGGCLVLGLLPWGLYTVSARLDPVLGFRLLPELAPRLVVTACLALPGLVFAIWSLVAQNAVGQGGPVEFAGIEISPKTRNLVVTGPYRYSINPMQFGACMLYAAYAVFLGSPAALVCVLAFALVLLLVIRPSEERRLLRDFGESYAEYRRRTSVFFPWPVARD